jgi:hypothetical protein
MLIVTTQPSSALQEQVDMESGQTETRFDTLFSAGFNDIGCLELYFPADTSYIRYSINPAVPWFSITPDEFTVNRNQSVVVRKEFTPSADGSFETIEVLEAQWFSWPRFIRWMLNVTTAIGEDGVTKIPQTKQLHPNYPNPFNPTTTFQYTTGKPGHVLLEIYDTQGRRITVLKDEFKNAGTFSINWNGKSDAGVTVGSGNYYARLFFDGVIQTRKAILLR